MSPEAQKLQALLFLAGESVARAELQRLLDVSAESVGKVIAEVSQSLDGHGLALMVTDTHVQFVTAPNVADFLSRYVEDESAELSAAAAETLTLIAYRGPITRSDIDAIRGVDSRRMVRGLVARGLVRKTAGDNGIAAYVVAEEFLQRMGMTAVDQLPHYQELSRHNNLRDVLGQSESL